MRRAKSLRIGVHIANAVVWGPVYRTHLRRELARRRRRRISLSTARRLRLAKLRLERAALVARRGLRLAESRLELRARFRFFLEQRAQLALSRERALAERRRLRLEAFSFFPAVVRLRPRVACGRLKLSRHRLRARRRLARLLRDFLRVVELLLLLRDRGGADADRGFRGGGFFLSRAHLGESIGQSNVLPVKR